MLGRLSPTQPDHYTPHFRRRDSTWRPFLPASCASFDAWKDATFDDFGRLRDARCQSRLFVQVIPSNSIAKVEHHSVLTFIRPNRKPSLHHLNDQLIERFCFTGHHRIPESSTARTGGFNTVLSSHREDNYSRRLSGIFLCHMTAHDAPARTSYLKWTVRYF
jgi:hypothetical protein